MKFSPEIPGLGKPLFMVATDRQAVLVTRTAKRMRQRTLDFVNEGAALAWCLDRQATFVLLPSTDTGKFN